MIFISGKQDDPFFAVLYPNLTVRCSTFFDKDTTLSSVVFDTSDNNVYAVAYGKKLPVEMQNAPAGVCVSLNMQSIDAGLISLDNNCQRNWAGTLFIRHKTS